MNGSELKKAYGDYYNDSITEWREFAAFYKAENIAKLTSDLKISKVLEVGAGEGAILHWLDKWKFAPELYAIEISESGVEYTTKRNIPSLKEIKLFDGYTIPYPDNHFDLVVCSHVMEHVEHPRLLLREIRRVSKHQVFEVPIDFSFQVDKKLDYYLRYGHINIFTPSLFRFLLKSEGFTVVKNRPTMFSAPILKRMFMNPIKRLVISIKQLLIKIIPGLIDIKPSHFAVLTKSNDKGLEIL